jgi:putative oxidoreductase
MRSGSLDWLGLIGRLMMSAIFLQSGYGKASHPSATMASLSGLHLPVPGAVYALTLAIEIGVALLFLVGFKVRMSALVLAAWCLATAYVAHYHPESREQMINLMKNICMAGGFLQVAAFGAGRFSVDRG